MTGKQFIKNITLDNAYYIAQSIKRINTWSEEKINKHIAPKIKACPGCWEQNACKECGCEAYSMFVSDKPCPNGNF